MSRLEDLDGIKGRATIALWPEAAALLGCGRNTAYQLAKEGKIPTLQLGRTLRVPVPKLLAMLGDSQPAA